MGSSKQLEIFPPPPLTEDDRIDALIAQGRADRHAYEATKPSPQRPPATTREQRRSRRKRDVRGATVSVKRMTKRDLAIGRILHPEGDDLPQRPRTRAECDGVHRPCPFVSCQHHLYLDVSARSGAIKMNFPDLEPDELPADASCSLDVAQRDGVTLERTGEVMNLTRERIRQVEVKALAKLQATHELFGLRDFHGDGGARGKRRLPVLEQPAEDEGGFDAEEFAGEALDAE